jgi:3-oxoacyl-[acyl-carrier protein] reductase
MKTYVLIGGSSATAGAFINKLKKDNNVRLIVFSRSDNPYSDSDNVVWHRMNIVEDDFKKSLIPETVDGLVYFPGSINLKPLTTLQPDDFRNDFEINFMGAVKSIKAFHRALRKSGSGSVVLFSTVAAKVGMPYHASIASMKAAVEGLARSLAAEFAPNIRVNCIAPSLTDTQMAKRLLSTDERRGAIQSRNPMKKIGQPDDLASAVAFLLDEQSAWITGQTIAVDGGMSTLNIS